jgi:hypothetical protein
MCRVSEGNGLFTCRMDRTCSGPGPVACLGVNNVFLVSSVLVFRMFQRCILLPSSGSSSCTPKDYTALYFIRLSSS